MRNLLIVTLGIILISCSCKNDLILNADWKDITVVYGLLNQKDSVQYLKVNKAYLGQGNALIMAQNPDSSTYYDNLDVIVEEWKNNQLNRTIIFDTTTIYNKEPGTFYWPNQLVYKSNVRLDSVDYNIEYRLKITNKITGKIISAKTQLIKPFYIDKPYRNPQNPVINFTSQEPAEVEFSGIQNGRGRFFQVYLRFYYTELDTVSLVFSNKTLDLFVGEAVYDNVSDELKMAYLGVSFYNLLKNKIPYNPNMVRKIRQGEEIELIAYAANDDFYTYMQAVKPSNNIVQDKPEFTNIENGIGIFASRLLIKAGYNLSPPSLDSLYSGSLTKNLGFQR